MFFLQQPLFSILQTKIKDIRVIIVRVLIHLTKEIIHERAKYKDSIDNEVWANIWQYQYAASEYQKENLPYNQGSVCL